MGVKSTVTLTRSEAEAKYIDLKLEKKRRKYKIKAMQLNNDTLENVLEALNDEANDGEGFQNYIIR